MKNTLLVVILGLALGGCGYTEPDNREQIRAPEVSIVRVVGRYVEADGIRALIIREKYSDTGWNGELSFSPPIGDWARSVRCRVSGHDLAVEIPASSGTFIAKMFRLDDPDTITGTLSPWNGTFRRVR